MYGFVYLSASSQTIGYRYRYERYLPSPLINAVTAPDAISPKSEPPGACNGLFGHFFRINNGIRSICACHGQEFHLCVVQNNGILFCRISLFIGNPNHFQPKLGSRSPLPPEAKIVPAPCPNFPGKNIHF